jgi:two-component sensor histidine kinase
MVHRGLADWSFSCEFGTESLRLFDPVPLLTHFLIQVPGLKPYTNTLNTILAELYSNALEHGILQLDSALKSTADGFATYYALRHERLNDLESGAVRFDMSHDPSEKGGVLVLEVSDTGSGFMGGRGASGDGGITHYYGRGIRLIESLCRKMEFVAPGNRVRVEFEWNWL